MAKATVTPSHSKSKRPKAETLLVSKVIVDPAYQCRVDGTDDSHVSDLVEALREKPGCLPRIRVVRVTGYGDILVDGFHTLEAHKRLKMVKVAAFVNVGSMLDAMCAAAGANATHRAKKRTNADIQKAVKSLLAFCQKAEIEMSSRQLAQVVGVSHTMVLRWKAQEAGEMTGKQKKETTKTTTETTDEEDDSIFLKPGKTTDSQKRESDTKPDTREASVNSGSTETGIVSSLEGGWESIALDEFLEVDEFVWEVIRDRNIVTAGQLTEALKNPQYNGFTTRDVGAIKVQLDRIKNQPPPAADPKIEKKPQGAVKGFDWNSLEISFAQVARAPDAILSNYPGERGSKEYMGSLKALTELGELFRSWRNRLGK